MSASGTCSSIPWIDALSGPNSTTLARDVARKRPSDVPPLVESAGVTPVTRRDGGAQRIDQPPARREERRAGQRPLQLVVDAVCVEHGVHARLQLLRPSTRSRSGS